MNILAQCALPKSAARPIVSRHNKIFFLFYDHARCVCLCIYFISWRKSAEHIGMQDSAVYILVCYTYTLAEYQRHIVIRILVSSLLDPRYWVNTCLFFTGYYVDILVSSLLETGYYVDILVSSLLDTGYYVDILVSSLLDMWWIFLFVAESARRRTLATRYEANDSSSHGSPLDTGLLLTRVSS